MKEGQPSTPLRLLWLGPWHSDSALFGRKAVNQAATHWSRGLLYGLSQLGCDIRVCTHCREQYWPNGELRPGGDDDFDSTFPVRRIGFVNLPGMRAASLASGYRRAVQRELVASRPEFVLSYNLESYHCAVADLLAGAGVGWVPIILDQDDPAADGWRAFSRQVAHARGLVFVSHWGFMNCPLSLPRMHLDGGCSGWRGEPMSAAPHNKTIVYSGKYDDRYGGLDLLFQIFAEVRDPDCKFVLTGKDAKRALRRYLKKEARAEYLGFLSPERLAEVQDAAAAFINPRPSRVSDNRMIFPSKVFEYLSYGKPVVSTWTDGLSPEYRELMLVPSDDTPAAYAELIERALRFTDAERAALSARIGTWVKTSHTWPLQASRLVEWLASMRRK